MPTIRITLALSLLAFGCTEGSMPPPTVDPVEPNEPVDSGPTDYDLELAELDERIAAEKALLDAQPSSWTRRERVASAYLGRAQLTGDMADYEQALAWVDEAYALAPEGSGPHVMAATVSFAVHRLAAMEPALSLAEGRAPSGTVPVAEIAGLRGDLALHRARFDEAAASYLEGDQLDPTVSAAFRLAMHAWQTGSFDEADAWIVEAMERLPGDRPRTEAYLHLQRGILDLDRGRWADARAHYEQGAEVFSGWWLIDEHLAEIALIEGRLEDARRAYEDVVERTGSPELMDALADTLVELGEPDEAAHWRAEARAGYEAQLAQLPEAAYGHALDHFLASEEAEDMARALDLAERNFALRPNGEAHVKLAWARILMGQVPEAVETMSALLATEYVSADAYGTGALLARHIGDPARAAELEALAVAVRPSVMDELEWLRPSLEGR